MAWPLIALAALAAGGTAAQMVASSKERAAMNKATKREMERQSGYQKEAQGLFEKSLSESGSTPTQQQLAEGEAKRLALMQKVGSVPMTSSEGAPLAPQTASVVSPQLAKSAAARAALSAYTDWDLQQWIKNLRAQQNLGVISGFARGSANILPYEIQDASQSASKLRLLGQGLNTLGSLGSGLYSAGLFGGGGGGMSGLAGGEAPGSKWTGMQPSSGTSDPWGGFAPLR